MGRWVLLGGAVCGMLFGGAVACGGPNAPDQESLTSMAASGSTQGTGGSGDTSNGSGTGSTGNPSDGSCSEACAAWGSGGCSEPINCAAYLCETQTTFAEQSGCKAQWDAMISCASNAADACSDCNDESTAFASCASASCPTMPDCAACCHVINNSYSLDTHRLIYCGCDTLYDPLPCWAECGLSVACNFVEDPVEYPPSPACLGCLSNLPADSACLMMAQSECDADPGCPAKDACLATCT